jgi:hypothetical protein
MLLNLAWPFISARTDSTPTQPKAKAWFGLDFPKLTVSSFEWWLMGGAGLF